MATNKRAVKLLIPEDIHWLLEKYADERGETVAQFARSLVISGAAKWTSLNDHIEKKQAAVERKTAISAAVAGPKEKQEVCLCMAYDMPGWEYVKRLTPTSCTLTAEQAARDHRGKECHMEYKEYVKKMTLAQRKYEPEIDPALGVPTVGGEDVYPIIPWEDMK